MAFSSATSAANILSRQQVEALGSFSFPEGEYQNSYVYLFRTKDGWIVEGREYLDTQVAARFFT